VQQDKLLFIGLSAFNASLVALMIVNNQWWTSWLLGVGVILLVGSAISLDSEVKLSWNDKPVVNPLKRVLVALYLTAAGVVGLAVGLLMMVVVVFSLPIHIVLKMLGRRGFSREGKEQTVTYQITREGFKGRS
jgi:hypothetical protein